MTDFDAPPLPKEQHAALLQATCPSLGCGERLRASSQVFCLGISKAEIINMTIYTLVFLERAAHELAWDQNERCNQESEYAFPAHHVTRFLTG